MIQSLEPEPDDIDYAALAMTLTQLPGYERKIIRVGVEIMADRRKRSVTAAIITTLILFAGVAVALTFKVPPAAFWAILTIGALAGVVVVLRYLKII